MHDIVVIMCLNQIIIIHNFTINNYSNYHSIQWIIRYFYRLCILVILKNCCRSYYKFIYGSCCTFTESTMTILSTNRLKLMIYCTIEMIKLNHKYINDIYDKNEPAIAGNIQCYKCMCCDCISMKFIAMLIVQVIGTAGLFANCLDIYILYKRNHVIKSNCTDIQSIFRAVITIFNGLLDICIILRKLFINCIVWLQNGFKSHYRFLYWYRYRLIHLQMVPAYINQLELSIYRTIEMIKSNIKDRTNIYGQNETQNKKNIQSYNSIFCTSISYILMMIVEVICIIFVFYEMIMMHHLFMICFDIYILYIHGIIIKTSYIHFQSIFTYMSVVRIFMQRHNICINCIAIMMEFKNDDCKSYFVFICDYYLPIRDSTMKYLSIILSKAIICIVFEWIKQYCDDLNDTFDRQIRK